MLGALIANPIVELQFETTSLIIRRPRLRPTHWFPLEDHALRTQTVSGRMPLLTAGHVCLDLYQGAVPLLVPFLVIERGYSFAAVGGVVFAASVLSSLVQPLVGLWADRADTRWVVPVATLLAGFGLAISGVGDSYILTCIGVLISGVGVAAYHPQAARTARALSQDSHISMSWFVVGGNVGFASAPLIVGPLIAWLGLRATPLLIVPALLGAALSVVALRRVDHLPSGSTSVGDRGQGADWRPFLRLSLVVSSRSVAFVGLSAFVAVTVSERISVTPATAVSGLAALYIAGMFGTLLGGRLAHRYGRIPVIRASYAAASFALAGLAWTPGVAVFPFIVLAGVLLYVPFSLHLTLGQDYLPRRHGTASGVTLGVTATAGGISAPLIGWIADETSLSVAISVLAMASVVAWIIARGLREPRVSDGAERPGTEMPDVSSA